MYQDGMSAELYDVLVLGPAEANPVAEARLAAALAARNGLPITTIAQGLSEKNLGVGQGLDRMAAEALVAQLQSMGALTSIRRSAGAAFPPSSQLTPPPGQGFRPLGTPTGGSLQGAAPGSGLRIGGLGANPSSAGSLFKAPPTSPGAERTPTSGPGLRPLGVLRPDAAIPTPAAPAARIQTNGLGVKVPTGAGAFSFNEPPPGSRPRATARAMAVAEPAPRAASPVATPAAPAGDPFASPEAGVASLELDRERRPTGHRPAVSVAGASGLNNPKLVAPKNASGLEVAGAKKDHVERCPKHGLLYDARKSSACRKCLVDGRKAVDDGPAGNLRSSPGRRALLGILFALVLGFAPAAYYARGPGAAEVNRLRAEQQHLSSGPGSEATMRRFDELEEQVLASRRKSMQFTLAVWVAASGLLLGVWYKIT
jgi:hypothetical protein